jgi:transcriptional regulator with XRE-family HTH domain
MIHDRSQRGLALARFAYNERKLRRRAGHSQRRAALLAGLHLTEIGLMERWLRMPRLETMVRLFGAYRSEPWELLDGLFWDLGDGGDPRPDSGERERQEIGGIPWVVEPHPMERFGLLLVRQRLRAGLSQEDLGWLVQMHRTEISDYERGLRQPRLDSLLQLAAAVKTQPPDLLSGMRWIPGEMISGGFYRAVEDLPEGRESDVVPA